MPANETSQQKLDRSNPDRSNPDRSNEAAQLPRPITLIINVKSRKGKAQFDAAIEALRAAGIPLADTHGVGSGKESVKLLKREIKAGANLVIVGGGDGTLSGCAGVLAGTQVAMAVLPLGTGNTLARSLGIPLDLKGAAQTIAAGHIEAMDVGRVNGRVFLNSVSIGLSAEIAHALDGDIKKKLGLLSWPVVGARVLWKHRARVLKISSPAKTFHVRTHQLVISNGRYIAGPVAAAPDASVQDSALRVFTLGGAKLKDVFKMGWKLLRGQHVEEPSARYFATQKVRVEAVRKRRIMVDVDGEINEHTPLELEVWPHALRVVVPKGFDAENV